MKMKKTTKKAGKAKINRGSSAGKQQKSHKSKPHKKPTVPPPSHAIHPGQVLLEMYLEPKKMTQAVMTDKLGWKLTRLNKLVNGKGGVTAGSALDLARVTHTKPEYWLQLQMDYDLTRAKEWERWQARRR